MAGSLNFGRHYCIPKGQSCRDCFANLSLGAITLVSPGDREGPSAVRPSCSSDVRRRLRATSAIFRVGDRPIRTHMNALTYPHCRRCYCRGGEQRNASSVGRPKGSNGGAGGGQPVNSMSQKVAEAAPAPVPSPPASQAGR